jgi:hypothetical protein
MREWRSSQDVFDAVLVEGNQGDEDSGAGVGTSEVDPVASSKHSSLPSASTAVQSTPSEEQEQMPLITP